MIKPFISITCLLFGLGVNASDSNLSGLNLQSAVEKSLVEASVEVDENSITSWEASLLDKTEIVVKINTTEGTQLGYGCHLHDETMACHEEHHSQEDEHNKSQGSLSFMKKGNKAALNKFEKTMKRKGQDLSVMNSYKVWTHEDNHSDHGAQADLWTKVNYTLKGVTKEIFILCHVHGTETKFSCHYNKTGEGEPTFSFENDHDHDEHHDDHEENNDDHDQMAL